MAFTRPEDIANRACQHLGVPRITSLVPPDSSKHARELAFAIDKIRRSQLQRSVWTFATRRAVLRTWTATTHVVTFATYSAATTYAAGDVVVDSTGIPWISTTASNTGHTPGAGGIPPWWLSYYGPMVADSWVAGSASAPFFPGDLVYKTTVVYILLGITTATTADPASGAPWKVLTGATSAAPINFSPRTFDPPTGTGTARNLYQLPANFLRVAPQDPKAAAVEHPGTLAGMQYNDWEIESGFLTSADASPIIFRFVADQTDVATMDDLFCEVWAANLGLETNQSINQSHEKQVDLQAIYQGYLAVAKASNAIEQGSTEAPLPEGQAQQPQGR
jgi:hypothetical protein